MRLLARVCVCLRQLAVACASLCFCCAVSLHRGVVFVRAGAFLRKPAVACASLRGASFELIFACANLHFPARTSGFLCEPARQHCNRCGKGRASIHPCKDFVVLLWIYAGAPLLHRRIQKFIPIVIATDTARGAQAYIHAKTLWYCYGFMLARPSRIVEFRSAYQL